MVTPKEIIELIESLPNSEYHIYTDERGVTVTSDGLLATLRVWDLWQLRKRMQHNG